MLNIFRKHKNRKEEGNIVYITSYPKSGNTWLRFMIGNYFYDTKLDFETINEVMPDLHFNPEQAKNIKDKYVFIKSHDLTKIQNKTIYIVRDGRDVAVSYYYHMKRTGEIEDTLSFKNFLKNDFLTEKYFGGWGSQIRKAKEISTKNLNIKLLRYEDLTEKTEFYLGEILKWIGETPDNNRLHYAIKKASFSELKKVEELNDEYIYNERKLIRKDYGFIRKGIIGDWKNHFDEEDIKLFNEKFGSELKVMNYV